MTIMNSGKSILITFLLFFIICYSVYPQYSEVTDSNDIFVLLQQTANDEGEIFLFQDQLIEQLIKSQIELNSRKGLVGYRIQINQWSGSNSRDKAIEKKYQFIKRFPDFNLVYINYESPYYKLRIGDFRNRNEAFELYNQVRRYFPNSYIVKTKIKFPRLLPGAVQDSIN